MTSTNVHTAARSLLLAAWRDPAVASEAGIALVQWATRVLTGDRDGYVGGLHRGRLPAVELIQKNDKWDFPSYTQGTVTSNWIIRVHSGLPIQENAEDQCRAIIYAGLIKARAVDYFNIGEETVVTLQESPLGYSMEIEFSVECAASLETYETTANDSDQGEVPDGGDVGGIRTTINYNTTSPYSLLALPAGQSLDSVEVRVVTPFDGVAPAVTIGIDGSQDKYMLSTDSDLTEADSLWERDSDDPGPQTVKIWISGTGATQGQIVVQLTTTATG